MNVTAIKQGTASGHRLIDSGGGYRKFTHALHMDAARAARYARTAGRRGRPARAGTVPPVGTARVPVEIARSLRNFQPPPGARDASAGSPSSQLTALLFRRAFSLRSNKPATPAMQARHMSGVRADSGERRRDRSRRPGFIAAIDGEDGMKSGP
ncbi:hypothetical protein [Burkholderia plantarii]|uniref:hypothetical protein n=1 Tax=Burkholderia plantarii TaxID=41899 RepID=UPI000F4FBC9B|nr:hypothetical protein [Burkholderia plantarii]